MKILKVEKDKFGKVYVQMEHGRGEVNELHRALQYAYSLSGEQIDPPRTFQAQRLLKTLKCHYKELKDKMAEEESK